MSYLLREGTGSLQRESADFLLREEAAGAPTVTTVGKIQLGPLDPPVAGTQTLSIRARASSGSGVLRTWLYDSDGTTIRGGPTDFTLTGSFQTFTLNPSGIVDYSALVVAFEGRNEAGGALTVEVSWVELQVPVTSGVPQIPLGASAATSTTTLVLRAPTQVPLGTAAAVSTTTLSLKATTTVVLGASAAQSSATLSLATATSFVFLESGSAVLLEVGDHLPLEDALGLTGVPLGAAAAHSTATLTLTAQTQVPLGASAGVSTTTAALSAKATITLQTCAAVSATSLTLAVPGAQFLTSAVGTFALLESGDHILLESGDSLTQEMPGGPLTAAATSTTSLSLKASTRVPLGASAAVSTTTLSLKATTAIPLGASAAVSTTTLALKATTRVPLGSAAAASTAALTVTTPAPHVVLAPVARATASAPAPALHTFSTRVVPVARASASFSTPTAKVIILPSAASATASSVRPTLHGVAKRADMPTTLELAPNATTLELAEGTTLVLGRETGLALFDLVANLEVADRATALVLREGTEGRLFFLDTTLELDEGLGDLELDEGAFELVLNG